MKIQGFMTSTKRTFFVILLLVKFAMLVMGTKYPSHLLEVSDVSTIRTVDYHNYNSTSPSRRNSMNPKFLSQYHLAGTSSILRFRSLYGGSITPSPLIIHETRLHDSLIKIFLKEHLWSIVSIIMFASIATLSIVSVPFIFSSVLLAVTAEPFRLKSMVIALSYILFLHIIELALGILYVRKSTELIANISTTLQYFIYSRILCSNIRDFELSNQNSLYELVMSDIDNMKSILMMSLSRDRGLRAYLELICALVFLYVQCWQIAILFTIVIPLTAYISSIPAKVLSKAVIQENQLSNKQGNIVREVFDNFKEVYLFSNQLLEKNKLKLSQEKVMNATLNSGYARGKTL